MKVFIEFTLLVSLNCFTTLTAEGFKVNKDSNTFSIVDENLKCTEFKDSLDPQFILHVPCVLIRLMESLKFCDLDTYKDSFLSKKIKNFYKFSLKLKIL